MIVPFFCALALLGWHADGRGGWLSLDANTPILSSIIKIARFMVIYKALTCDKKASSPKFGWEGRNG